MYWLSTFWFLLIGAALGSFGNVLILRLPERRTLRGRSACPHCKRTLQPLELLPLLSFLWMQGRCRGCAAHISWQYPVVEAASMLVFVSALPVARFALLSALALGIGLWALLLIAIIDARTCTIPDVLTLIVAVAGLVWQLLSTQNFPLGSSLVLGGFFTLQWLFSRGKWIGSGDVLLGFAIGMLLGSIPLSVTTLLLTYVGGSIVVLLLLATKRISRSARVAFGPMLAAGAYVSLLAGEPLLAAVRLNGIL